MKHDPEVVPVNVNVPAILELADFLENGKFGFDMGNPYASPLCGTAGCIGGHAAVLWKETRYPWLDDERVTWDHSALDEKLKITVPQSRALFFPGDNRPGEHIYQRITRAQAVEALRNLARTGKVHWPEYNVGPV